MAVATCVLTCTTWFRISSCSCRKTFSGSSAFLIIVLRLAPSKVSTRSNKFIYRLPQSRVHGEQECSPYTLHATYFSFDAESTAEALPLAWALVPFVPL